MKSSPPTWELYKWFYVTKKKLVDYVLPTTFLKYNFKPSLEEFVGVQTENVQKIVV